MSFPITMRLSFVLCATLALGAPPLAAQEADGDSTSTPDAASAVAEALEPEAAPDDAADVPPSLEDPAAAEAAPDRLAETSRESAPSSDEDAAGENGAESWIPQHFGLDATLGVSMGMPLDQAVGLLRQRGFRPQAAQAQRLIEKAPEDDADYPRSATGVPPIGLVVTRAAIPTPWGIREVPIGTTVVMERRVDGVAVRVQISAEPRPSGDGGSEFGTGRVFGVEVFQDYAEAAGPIAWLRIEARLRQAAVAPPTCEMLADRISLIWSVTPDGTALGPQDDYAGCSAAVYGAIEAAAPDAVIGRLVDSVEGEPVTGSSLIVQINPEATQGWIWMQRLDAGLQAEVVGSAVRAAREVPPAAVATVDF